MCSLERQRSVYSYLWKSISQLRSVTCRMGSHSVTFHLTQANTPRLYPSQTGRYSIYRPFKDGGWSKPRPRVQRATSHGCYATAQASKTRTHDLAIASRSKSKGVLCLINRRWELTCWISYMVPAGGRCLDHAGASVVRCHLRRNPPTAQVRGNSRAVQTRRWRRRRSKKSMQEKHCVVYLYKQKNTNICLILQSPFHTSSYIFHSYSPALKLTRFTKYREVLVANVLPSWTLGPFQFSAVLVL